MQEEKQAEVKLPFNNLFLNAGYVSGSNHPAAYVITILITIVAYLLAPMFTLLHVIVMLMKKGFTVDEIVAENGRMITDYGQTGIDRNYILLGLMFIFVLTFLAFRVSLRSVHRKNFLSVMTGYDRFRYNRFFAGFLSWGILMIISFVIEFAIDPSNFSSGLRNAETGESNIAGFFGSAVILVFLLPVQTCTEEVIFRGYFVQGLSLLARNAAVPLVLTSVLFGLAHGSNPEVAQYGAGLMYSYYMGFGLFLGLISLLDEGLELAFGIHLANNLLSSIMVTSDHTVIPNYSLFISHKMNAPLEAAITLGCVIALFFAFRYKFRWKSINFMMK